MIFSPLSIILRASASESASIVPDTASVLYVYVISSLLIASRDLKPVLIRDAARSPERAARDLVGHGFGVTSDLMRVIRASCNA